VEIIQGFLIHEKQSVTVAFDSGLVTERCRSGAVVAGDGVVLDEGSFSELTGDQKAAFDDLRENENGYGLRGQGAGGEVRAEKTTQPLNDADIDVFGLVALALPASKAIDRNVTVKIRAIGLCMVDGELFADIAFV